jgi:hypothetical protein
MNMCLRVGWNKTTTIQSFATIAAWWRKEHSGVNSAAAAETKC